MGLGFNCLKEAVYILPLVPRNSWYSFYQLQKDERVSWPWSHPVVLNTGPLAWESSTLTTRSLLQSYINIWFCKQGINCTNMLVNKLINVRLISLEWEYLPTLICPSYSLNLIRIFCKTFFQTLKNCNKKYNKLFKL